MIKKIFKSLICIIILSTSLYSQNINKIAFTFDDGPKPKITEEILDILKENDVKATFFVIGKNAKVNSKILKRMDDEGHLVENHSYTHPNYTKLSTEAIKKELQSTQDVIYKATGKKPKYFRPPYGAMKKSQKKEIENSMGIKSVLWDICPEDWKKENDVNYITEYLLKNSRPNVIVLLHDNPKTVQAIKKVIPILKERGYDFVGVDEMKR
ncbi:polysaccharide deacetylase family protein [uncultured Cetobacterium sp.]|uniref:polysaccharide deacetylase family protein n=1 Tax=uncultured Cetobacterium sp. TaxID=527638 RepID=UPI002639EE93|nr:polysaccharide deacetylase family protein [uncultured Cetobacterium sp.]